MTSTPCSIKRRLIAGSFSIGYVGSCATRLLKSMRINLAPGRRRADAVQGKVLLDLAEHVGPIPKGLGGGGEGFRACSRRSVSSPRADPAGRPPRRRTWYGSTVRIPVSI